MKKEYPENFIADYPSEEVKKLTREIHNSYPKANGWIPFKAYDMVQCGYPFSDHGEMILREDGGTNAKGEILPSTGMWCKVEDVMKYIEELKKELKCTYCGD